MKEVKVVNKLKFELQAVENELDLLMNKGRDKREGYLIDEAVLVRRILLDLQTSLPTHLKLVELPPDPVLIDYLEERGYTDAADILRGEK